MRRKVEDWGRAAMGRGGGRGEKRRGMKRRQEENRL